MAYSQSATGPSRDDVVGTLSQEVDRFIASFNQCNGGDADPLLDSLNSSDWATTQRRYFDQGLSRVELTQLGRGIEGYLPEYAAWLRYERSVPQVLPSGLRHNVSTFADYAVSNNLVDLVESLSLDPGSADALGRAFCFGGYDTAAIKSVTVMLDQVLTGGASSYTKQQIYYLLVLLALPQAAERSLYAELAGAGGWGAQSAQQRMALLAQRCSDDPTYCRRSFFTEAAQMLGFLNGVQQAVSVARSRATVENTDSTSSCPGAGGQSTALALMAVRGGSPGFRQPVAAIFADTGWEPRGVYDHLGLLVQELDEALLHIVGDRHPDETPANIDSDTPSCKRLESGCEQANSSGCLYSPNALH